MRSRTLLVRICLNILLIFGVLSGISMVISSKLESDSRVRGNRAPSPQLAGVSEVWTVRPSAWKKEGNIWANKPLAEEQRQFLGLLLRAKDFEDFAGDTLEERVHYALRPFKGIAVGVT